MTHLAQAKQLVAESGRQLLCEGLVARTWGNVSCRTGENSFVITPSGLGYDSMHAEDVVPFDMLSGKWTGPRKPSSEKRVHAAVYRQFPDAGFVIHTHQTYASALGLAGFDNLRCTPGEERALGGVALAKYGLPGSKTLRNNVARALAGGTRCVLMAHHGALIAGTSAQEAFARAKLLEAVCKNACCGQPLQTCGDPALARQLADALKGNFAAVGVSTAAAAAAVAAQIDFIRPQLDDMAQMIGPKLIRVQADTEGVRSALEKFDAVLVKGVGTICRAQTANDCDALCMLVEKACISFLHTRALDAPAALSALDCLLMRMVYKMKYAKRIGG